MATYEIEEEQLAAMIDVLPGPKAKDIAFALARNGYFEYGATLLLYAGIALHEPNRGPDPSDPRTYENRLRNGAV